MTLVLKLPFIIYTLAHSYLFYKQITAGPPDETSLNKFLVYLPMLIVTAGCALDNFRLTLGICATGKVLSYFSYGLHLIALPTLVSTVVYFVERTSGLPDYHWMLYGAAFVSIALTLDGIHIYSSDVSGKLMVKPCPGGLTQYGLVKTPPRFLAGVIVLSLSLLACGSVYWMYKSDYYVFIVQLTCFIAQAASPALVKKAWLTQVMNLFEVIVIANMIWIKDHVL